jgi:ubiquinone/menaquinone biosynthesis C-methylase UbiE
MGCARQAAAILSEYFRQGESLLDVGCGSGYFFHSISGMKLHYTGIDAAPSLIRIGQEEMPRWGCSKERLICARIEDLQGAVDHVVCLNVLSNMENFHRPLERLLKIAGKTLILRESIWDQPSKYCYVQDIFLDKGVNLNVHVNTYNSGEIHLLAKRMGFVATFTMDERTQGKAELVIGHPHHWSFMVFKKAK